MKMGATLPQRHMNSRAIALKVEKRYKICAVSAENLTFMDRA